MSESARRKFQNFEVWDVRCESRNLRDVVVANWAAVPLRDA
jgi:hypothetical protein